MSLRKALKLTREKNEKYYLVFWEKEDSVSVVPATCLADGKELAVGEVCDIMIGRKSYSGRISATGTKNEMDRLESLYIQGNYTPSACDDVPEAANSDLPGKSPCPQEKESRKGTDKLDDPNACPGGKEGALEQAKDSGINTQMDRPQLANSNSDRTRSKSNSSGPQQKKVKRAAHKENRNPERDVSSNTPKSQRRAGKCGAARKVPKPAKKGTIIAISNSSEGESIYTIPSATTLPTAGEHLPVTNATSVTDCSLVTSNSQPDDHPYSPVVPPPPMSILTSPSSHGILHEGGSSLSDMDVSECELNVRVEDLEVRLMHMEKIQSHILTRLKSLEQQQTGKSPSYQVPFNAPAVPIAEPISNHHSSLLNSTTQPTLPDFECNLFQPFPELEADLFPCNNHPVPSCMTPKAQPVPSYTTPHPVPRCTTPKAQTQPSNRHSQLSGTPESLPCPVTLHSNATSALPSSNIPKHLLRNVQDVLEANVKLRTECSAGTLCQKLAKEAIFGKEVMRQCTPGGTREYPALPQEELFELKKIMFEQFPRFHTCPGSFEPLWKRCIVSIEQACKRLRAHPK